jgi:hypothetical protein
LKVTPHRCHPEKYAVGERAVGKQAREYSLLLSPPPLMDLPGGRQASTAFLAGKKTFQTKHHTRKNSGSVN